MSDQNLEINVLYWSSDGRETSFTAIADGSDYMDEENYEPKAFWSVMGGFQVTLEGYKMIFSSSDFHYMVKATSFLIHSLYLIAGMTSDWFDSEDIFEDKVTLKSTGDNLICLKKMNGGMILFSFEPKEVRPRKRGDRFFDGVALKEEEWFKEADIALQEYFEILLRVANDHEDNETSRIMLSYYGVWKAISRLR